MSASVWPQVMPRRLAYNVAKRLGGTSSGLQAGTIGTKASSALSASLCRHQSEPLAGDMSDALKQHIDARRVHALTCRECKSEKPQTCFWPMDISNRGQDGGLSCRECQPTPPGERPRNKLNSLTCQICKIEKPRANFWTEDISKKGQKGGVSCTDCQPMPPRERRKKRQMSQ